MSSPRPPHYVPGRSPQGAGAMSIDDRQPSLATDPPMSTPSPNYPASQAGGPVAISPESTSHQPTSSSSRNSLAVPALMNPYTAGNYYRPGCDDPAGRYSTSPRALSVQTNAPHDSAATGHDTNSLEVPGNKGLLRPHSASPLPGVRMQYRYLGRSGLKVSALGLGSWLTYGTQVSPEVTLQCLRTAHYLGINYFDTAEIYANGGCESVLGRAIKNLGWDRSEFVISTKLFWGGSGPNQRGLSRKHVVEGLRGSLDRLQLDYVDIVIAHRPDPDTPMEEVVRAFDFVINRGQALYWGTSEWSPAQVTQAILLADKLGLIKPVLEQPQYNMLNRERVEQEYVPLCREYGLGLTTWSPLLSGVLSGKYLQGIAEGTRLSMSRHVIVDRIRRTLVATPEGQVTQTKVQRIANIAEQLGCTPAQLAIAWCLRNRNVSCVLMGATHPQQIEENVVALAIANRMNGEWDAVLEEVLANKPESPFNYRDA